MNNKIFDKKDIITCINAEDAKKYIGKLGYFANGLNGFADIRYFAPYSLDNVQVGIDKPFFYKEKNFALFLPEDKVKEIEEPKKYRPFKNVEEFELYTGFSVGSVITIRHKRFEHTKTVLMYIGHDTDVTNKDYVILGGFKRYVDELIEHEYLQKINNIEQWRKFGVLDED